MCKVAKNPIENKILVHGYKIKVYERITPV